MKRRNMLAGLLLVPSAPLIIRLSLADTIADETAMSVEALGLPPSHWRDKVSAEAYAVLFEEGTEEPGSSPLNRFYEPGTYLCAACHLPLFRSEHKFDSGTGWPSFSQPIEGHVGTRWDFRRIWPRTEYHCARCGGHQGHIFKDGPPPLHQRWSNNGVALVFVPAGEVLPEPRQ